MTPLFITLGVCAYIAVGLAWTLWVLWTHEQELPNYTRRLLAQGYTAEITAMVFFWPVFVLCGILNTIAVRLVELLLRRKD